MVFTLLRDKNVIINGKVITFKAGEIDTTNKDEVDALSKCKGVTKSKGKSKDT